MKIRIGESPHRTGRGNRGLFEFDARASAAPTMTFTALTARMSLTANLHLNYGAQVRTAFDATARSADTTDNELPVLLRSIVVNRSAHRNRAIAQARALLGDLLNLGVVR